MSVIRNRTIMLDAEKTSSELALAGHYLSIIAVSSPDAACSLAIDEPDGATFRIGLGWSVQHVPFDRVFVTHDAQPGEWMVIAIGGEPDLARPGEVSITPAVVADLVDFVDPTVSVDNFPAVQAVAPPAWTPGIDDHARWHHKQTGTTSVDVPLQIGNGVPITAVPAGKFIVLDFAVVEADRLGGGTIKVLDDQGVVRAGTMGGFNTTQPALHGLKMLAGWKLQVNARQADSDAHAWATGRVYDA